MWLCGDVYLDVIEFDLPVGGGLEGHRLQLTRVVGWVRTTLISFTQDTTHIHISKTHSIIHPSHITLKDINVALHINVYAHCSIIGLWYKRVCDYLARAPPACRCPDRRRTHTPSTHPITTHHNTTSYSTARTVKHHTPCHALESTDISPALPAHASSASDCLLFYTSLVLKALGVCYLFA